MGVPTAGEPLKTINNLDLIMSAESAAPASVAKEATVETIVAMSHTKVLRQGRNGFTCMPDVPETPGPDPMCADAGGMVWVHAWIARKIPLEGLVGVGYMLAGGSDPDNLDPYAMVPKQGREWVRTGPHIILFNVGELAKLYPTSAQPDTSKPYVMYPGTPYASIVLPVE
jgi:hypothetical protein